MSKTIAIGEITRVLEQLCAAEKPVRILRSLAWPATVRQAFFDRGAQRLPEVDYPVFDPDDTLQAVQAARARITQKLGTEVTPITAWLQRLCKHVEQGALMLSKLGQPGFLEHSGELYGKPVGLLPDGKTTVLSLAESFDKTLDKLAGLDLGLQSPAYDSAALAAEMQIAVERMFGEQAPEIQIMDELSANALAGATRIRIRRDASFSDKDVAQLIQHEAYIHVATSLNGRQQDALPILGRSHPGTTRTQEGLAVFAEFITGSMELDRLRRLTDRVIAIQMVIDGADFMQIYQYFLERTNNDKTQSFENARRVFRGGVLHGGTPFTKDIVYLEGLLRVHNFLRIAVSLGRADLLHLLFCGKLDIEDITALAELAAAGHCKPPLFLPPWAADLRFLLSYLAYSSFLNTVDLSQLRIHYAALTEAAPVCAMA